MHRALKIRTTITLRANLQQTCYFNNTVKLSSFQTLSTKIGGTGLGPTNRAFNKARSSKLKRHAVRMGIEPIYSGRQPDILTRGLTNHLYYSTP